MKSKYCMQLVLGVLLLGSGLVNKWQTKNFSHSNK